MTYSSPKKESHEDVGMEIMGILVPDSWQKQLSQPFTFLITHTILSLPFATSSFPISLSIRSVSRRVWSPPQRPFRVCSWNREVKKGITAGTLEELKEKVRTKRTVFVKLKVLQYLNMLWDVLYCDSYLRQLRLSLYLLSWFWCVKKMGQRLTPTSSS